MLDTTQWLEKFQEALTAWGPKVVAAAVVLVLGWIAARMLIGLMRRAMGRGGVDATLIGFLANVVHMALIALVVITALAQLGVATTSFAAVLGASALAVGFALQSSLSNLAAGVMVIFFRPFKAGDFVEAGGISGIVEEIQIFSTKLRTPDNKEVTVPNSQITGDAITNYSARDTRRIDLVFGIGYDDDIQRAKQLLEQIVAADGRVLADPEPVIAVSELADSSVNFVVRPWVSTDDYWVVTFDLTEKVKLRFDADGISIPVPQTDVHLHPAEQAA